MKTIFYALIGCVCLFLPRPVPLADYPADLNHWYATEVPEPGSEQSLIAEDDIEHEWLVTKRGHQVVPKLIDHPVPVDPLPISVKPGLPLPFGHSFVDHKKRFHGRHIDFKVEGGWIIGFNRGEWGGELWWFSLDGTHRYKISDSMVVSIVTSKSSIFLLEGINHGLLIGGKVCKLLRNEKNIWTKETVYDLKETPLAGAVDVDDTLIVVTLTQLLKLHPITMKVEPILNSAFWDDLNPSSIAIIPSGRIYVGMRHGIVKLDKTGSKYVMKWLLPNKSIAEQKYKHRGFR